MLLKRVLFIVLVVFLSQFFVACTRVDSGEAGLLWKAIGGTKNEVYNEGFHLLAPWNRMFTYDLRTQEHKEDLQILAANGLQIDMDVSIRYRPKKEEIYFLQIQTGQDYYEKIVGPTLRSEGRNVVSKYQPEEIYATKRSQVENEIIDGTIKAIQDKHIIIDAILIRDVRLPDKLKQAITEKLEEEQRALKMKFTLQREEQEAERKRIEAKGIADFQEIVARGISPELLKWKGIEATSELSKSPNTKVIVIGAGQSGLPIILGGDNK